MSPIRLTYSFVASLWLSAACESSLVPTDGDATLMQCVSALRAASNAEKKPWLERLEHSTCDSEAVCRLKSVCVSGYRNYDVALESARATRYSLSLDSGATVDERSAILLLAAENALNEAHRAMNRCAELEMELRTGKSRNRR